jgi:hypothetical protein
MLINPIKFKHYSYWLTWSIKSYVCLGLKISAQGPTDCYRGRPLSKSFSLFYCYPGIHSSTKKPHTRRISFPFLQRIRRQRQDRRQPPSSPINTLHLQSVPSSAVPTPPVHTSPVLRSVTRTPLSSEPTWAPSTAPTNYRDSPTNHRPPPSDRHLPHPYNFLNRTHHPY